MFRPSKSPIRFNGPTKSTTPLIEAVKPHGAKVLPGQSRMVWRNSSTVLIVSTDQPTRLSNVTLEGVVLIEWHNNHR